MPFVLDYDGHGNVIGGHFVENLPDRHLRLEPHRDIMAGGCNEGAPSGEWLSGHFPYAQRHINGRQSNPLQIDAPPTHFEPLRAPPAAPTPFTQRPAPRQTQSPAFSYGYTPAPLHSGFDRPLQAYHHHTMPSQSLRQNLTLPGPPRPSQPIQHPFQRSPYPHQVPDQANFSGSRAYPMPSPSVETTHDIPPEMPQSGISMTSLPSSGAVTPNHLDVHPRQLSGSVPSVDTYPESLAKANRFVADFWIHFKDNAAAITSFDALGTDYNKRAIDETELYAGIYRILFRTNSLHLLGGLREFLPPKWKGVDLTWLNKAIENDLQKEMQVANKETEEKTNETEETSTPAVPKKKRPVNGFRASHDAGALPPRSILVKLPTTLPPSPTSPNDRTLSSSPVSSPVPKRGKKHKKQAGVVKLPVKVPKGVPSTPPTPKTGGKKDKSTPKKTVPSKRSAETTLNDSSVSASPGIKGKFRYTSLLGSAVPHAGPVYPNRRAVLARPSQPYIHAACGQSFSHPQDVKAHERKAKSGVGCKAEGKEWDDHPSCKADYPQLNYVQVKDGYVILDQESLDKLEMAIAAGLKFREEQSKKTMAETADVSSMQGGGQGMGDGGSEHVDVEMVDVGDEEADMRAAALGLRKRSKR